MPTKLKNVLSLLAETYNEWSEDNAPRLGAALAYYTIFSIAPLLVIVIAVVGIFWGNQSGQVRGEVLAQIQALVGPSGTATIEELLENMGREESTGWFASVLGLAALLFGATTLFAQLRDSLNTIWGVQPDPDRTIWNLLIARVLSFGLILTVGFLLLVSLLLSALVSAFTDLVEGLAPGIQYLSQAAELLVSFGIATLLFALIYRYLSDARLAWRDVFVGAALTSLLFTIGKFALGLYLGSSATGSAYGAAGSLVLLLIWVYYSAQILFFGAEFTKVYARRYGTQVRPARHAVRVGPPRPAEEESVEQKNAAPEAAAAPAEVAAPPPRSAPPGLAERLKRYAPAVLAFFVGRAIGRRS